MQRPVDVGCQRRHGTYLRIDALLVINELDRLSHASTAAHDRCLATRSRQLPPAMAWQAPQSGRVPCGTARSSDYRPIFDNNSLSSSDEDDDDDENFRAVDQMFANLGSGLGHFSTLGN